MSDVCAQLLLTVVAAVVFVGLIGLLVLRAPGAEEAGLDPAIPDFALQPAVPAAADPTPTPTPTPSATRPANRTSPPVTIAVAGDVHGEPPIEAFLAGGGNPLVGVADILQAADIALVNLETAVGTVGSPADKTYTFQADPALTTSLAEAGVDVVTLANNHSLDFGTEAAAETRQVAEDAGLAVVGQGEDADQAYAPHVLDIDGRTVAVIGLSRVFPVIEWAATDQRAGLASAYDPHLEVALQAVRDAAATADHVVVAIHWGRERWACPDGTQRVLARALVEAGADVIAGHHPHVLQGVVAVDGAVVAYSLGNLVFYARTQATRQSGVLTVTLGAEGAMAHEWAPALIDGEGRPLAVATQAAIPDDANLTAASSAPECGPPTASTDALARATDES